MRLPVLLAILAVNLCNGDNEPKKSDECSTSGRGTFIDFWQTSYFLPTTCTYVFSRHDVDTGAEFNIQLRRGETGLLEEIQIMIDGVEINVYNGTITVNNQLIQIPYGNSLVQIQKYAFYTRFLSRRGILTLTWNNKDALWLNLPKSPPARGICGNPNSPLAMDTSELIARSTLDSIGKQCGAIQRSCIIKDSVISAYFKVYASLRKSEICSCKDKNCNCMIYTELARQKAINYALDPSADKKWIMWRSNASDCVAPSCKGNQVFFECDNAYQPTCSQQQPYNSSKDSCVPVCKCDGDSVLNDIDNNNQCIGIDECPCMFDGTIYRPGETKTSFCDFCTCTRGVWNCQNISCPAQCKIENGYQITTFDGKQYDLYGNCDYIAVLSKGWSLVTTIRLCQLGEKQTCLLRVKLFLATSVSGDVYTFTNDGSVLLNEIPFTGILNTEKIKLLRPTAGTIYVDVNENTFNFSMQIQISHSMQLYLSLPESAKGTTKGLCGTYNGISSDDFLSLQNSLETQVNFADSWKLNQDCGVPDPNPCVNLHNGDYAKEHCAVLIQPENIFASCHSIVPYHSYYEKCISATCRCAQVNACLCDALGNYARDCANNGRPVGDWRKGICEVKCKENQIFIYNMTSCDQTCESLSRGQELTCGLPVDGCGCPEGMYKNHKEICVEKHNCECYYKNSFLQSGDTISSDGSMCICENGVMNCVIKPTPVECENGTVYVQCNDVNQSFPKTCSNWHLNTLLIPCTPGCQCPEDMVKNEGKCISVHECPCTFGQKPYPPGSSIKHKCNSCTCQNGLWNCTTDHCPSTCHVYGDGHYITFDEKRYTYDGNCEYTFVGDFCGQAPGTFKISSESIPCCENGVICSRSIKVEIEEGTILQLQDSKVNVLRKGNQTTNQQYISYDIGLHLILKLSAGITLIWDKSTHLSVTLDPQWNNTVCGLCGNMNGNINDDFTTQQNSIVTGNLEFGNSWKVHGSVCSDTVNETFPCDANPYCRSWAERKCNIIWGPLFEPCHNRVYPQLYYDACVLESCICDLDGKFQGFCTAVAIYAEECRKEGVCINWRTPEMCPVFCDFYNKPDDECLWHYEPCGKQLTCQRNGIASVLEGCYMRCPETKPYLDELTMTCVDRLNCSCFYNGAIIPPGPVNETSCACTNGSVSCITTTATATTEVVTTTTKTAVFTSSQSTVTVLETTITETTPTTTLTTTTETPTTITSATTTPTTATTGTISTIVTTVATTRPTETTAFTSSQSTVTELATTIMETTPITTLLTTTETPTITSATTIPTTTTTGTISTIVTTVATIRPTETTSTGTVTLTLPTTSETTLTSEITSVLTTTESTPKTTTITSTEKTSTTETAVPTIPSTEVSSTETTLSLTTTETSTPTVTTVSTTETTASTMSATETSLITETMSVTETGTLTTEIIVTSPETTETRMTTITPTTTTPTTETTKTTTIITTIETTISTETVTVPSIGTTTSTETTTSETKTMFTIVTETETLPTLITESTTSSTETKSTSPTTTEMINTTEITTATETMMSTTKITPTISETQTTISTGITSTETILITESTSTPTVTMPKTETTTVTQSMTTLTKTITPTITTVTETVPPTTPSVTQVISSKTTTPTTHTKPTSDIVVKTYHPVTSLSTSTKDYLKATTTSTVSTTSRTTSLPPSSTATTTSTVSTTSRTTSLPPSSTECFCDADKTKRPHDSWRENCNIFTCTSACTIDKGPVSCPVQPICNNKMKGWDNCCLKDCFCQCNVYGDPHYETFNGISYDFLENCTYSLVEEINPTYNFSIIVDNYFDDGWDASSGKGIMISYNKSSVQIIGSTNTVYFNGIKINPPYSENGISITSTKSTVHVNISSINTLVVSYSDESYEINIPQNLFQNNTRGQCGVCGGESGCVRKTGTFVSDSCCSVAASDWMVDDPNKPYCKKEELRPCVTTTSTPSPYITSTTPIEYCTCSLLDKPLFDPCRNFVNLQEYKRNCLFDVQTLHSEKAACSVLKRAVAKCETFVGCIDWRNYTCGFCNYDCPGDLVYEACRKSSTEYCAGRMIMPAQPFPLPSEGCFCPEGKKQRSEYLEECVTDCPPCCGPRGEPKYLGDTWISNCYNCTCSNYTKFEECTPLTCPAPPVCNATERLNVYNYSGACCPVAVCEPICKFQQKEYGIGETIPDPIRPCISYTCQENGLVTTVQKCTNKMDCPEEDRIYDARKCCYTCKTECYPVPYNTTIGNEKCSAVISTTICGGICNSLLYINGTQSIVSLCECCKAVSTESREAMLVCKDGSHSSVTYDYVKSCSCSSCEKKSNS